jgi:hypothetical protein
MATKRRHEEQKQMSSRTTLAILAIGGIAVAALIVWALTRTVETPVETRAADEPGGFTTPSAVAPAPSTTSNPLTATASFPQPATSSAAPPAPEGDEASVPRIAVEDLYEKLKANAVTLIDVRDDIHFNELHITGAMHIPLARVANEVETLPKNKPIVTYCT